MTQKRYHNFDVKISQKTVEHNMKNRINHENSMKNFQSSELCHLQK